eukprot:scaffold274_cov215-Chaetoceros_neogracile.AAC.5
MQEFSLIFAGVYYLKLAKGDRTLQSLAKIDVLKLATKHITENRVSSMKLIFGQNSILSIYTT